jgi:hypothetical protein
MLYSGYKKKTTLKYEVSISQAGLPVNYSGPWPGPEADITIFRHKLKPLMEANDWMGLADGTYQGEDQYLIVPPRPFRDLTPIQREFGYRLARIRGMVENFIARLKAFACLSLCWRHSLQKHRFVFFTILIFVAIDLRMNPLRR